MNRGEREKIIVTGATWHKDCYNRTKSTAPSRDSPFVPETGRCPGCGGVVEAGMNRGEREKIIVRGDEWHKDCYDRTKEKAPPRNVPFVPETGRCLGCRGVVEAGMNRGEREKIIIRGDEWHKDCYDRSKGIRQEPTRMWSPNLSTCPGCGHEVPEGNRGEREKIVICGAEWHKDCYASQQEPAPVGFCAHCGQRRGEGTHFCSGCGMRY